MSSFKKNHHLQSHKKLNPNASTVSLEDQEVELAQIVSQAIKLRTYDIQNEPNIDVN